MKNSSIVSIMGVDHHTKDLLEEDVGLACPPFDQQDFMAAENSFFDLSEQVFFSGIEDHRKSVERVEGSSGNLNEVQIKQKRHGKGKDMKVLEQVYKYNGNARKDTDTETKAENKKTSAKAAIVDEKVSLQHRIIESNKKKSRKADEKVSLEHRVIESSKKTSTKAAIVDEKVSLKHRIVESKADAKVSLEHRVNLAKSKLHESCQQIEKEKKRRQMRVLDTSETPKFRQVECRPQKHHGGFAHKFRSSAENIESNKKTSTKAAIDEKVSTEHRVIDSNKKTSTKAAIVDETGSLKHKINLAKRKLHERYEQIEQEKKRRQIQVLDVSELPKFPQVKCRPEKHHSGSTHKFRRFADCH